MKGLILCAGKGTRLQPFSFSQPKTMLPVANKPVLQYCIENLVRHGVVEIGIVINPHQQIVKDFVGNGERFGGRVHYIYQTEQKGISHAVKEAETFIGQDSFILLLGDNLIAEDLETLIDSYQRNQSNGSILLSAVPNPQEFGIAEIKGNEIIGIAEKPKVPKSNLAVIGAYLFDSTIFQAVGSISPSPRGEYEITDAIQWLLKNGHKISYTITRKLYSDVGTVERWLEANEWMMKKNFEEQIVLGKHTTLENCTLKGPVVIGENCVLRNAVIGPFVSVQDQCQINNCTIEHCILLQKVVISDVAQPVKQSVFGREVHFVGLNKKIKKVVNLYLGDKSKIEMQMDGDDQLG
jgi:glucose-1-phosphate thymidylyltransferase